MGISVALSKTPSWWKSNRFGSGRATESTFYLLWAGLPRTDVKKVQNELNLAFLEVGSVPDSVICNQLIYLQAVLNEAFLLYTATIAVLPKIAMTDTTLDDSDVPRGTNIATQNLTIHRDPQAFGKSA
ncbi:hypothetical protein PEBR_12837 [Penicillium brasilianum]|uniref:Uncharacterized protein n=1 Tax=Penicillium brasilianum TaxID=104259 RepID=A0A1S9RSW4_PENBI|nr:hypothetical protein PEBR_12837 [Penicillium brasilianum]